MKIEIPHRFRLAMNIADAVYWDWAWNHYADTRQKNRTFGREIFSVDETDDCRMRKFTIRHALSGVVVWVWMKDHMNAGHRMDGTKREDWRVYRVELNYKNLSPRRFLDEFPQDTITICYDQEELMRIKNSQFGWHFGEVDGEQKHKGK